MPTDEEDGLNTHTHTHTHLNSGMWMKIKLKEKKYNKADILVKQTNLQYH